jgi:nitrate reductase gamma subunit
MYEFLTGPALWVSFSFFFLGLIGRTVLYIRGLDWKIDRVAYSTHIGHGIRGALKSVGYWLIPFGTKGWQSRPVFTVMFFLFHTCLLVVPIFLFAHQMIFFQKWGIMLPSLSEYTADALTLIVITVGLVLFFRRIGLPEVRILTGFHDIAALLIAVMPFLTGFLAHHQVSSYTFWLYAHLISGHILLIAVPFTKLSQCVLFFMSRIQIGMDFGVKRGGMKGTGRVW